LLSIHQQSRIRRARIVGPQEANADVQLAVAMERGSPSQTIAVQIKVVGVDILRGRLNPSCRLWSGVLSRTMMSMRQPIISSYFRSLMHGGQPPRQLSVSLSAGHGPFDEHVLLLLTTILTREKRYLSAGLVSWRLGVLRHTPSTGRRVTLCRIELPVPDLAVASFLSQLPSPSLEQLRFQRFRQAVCQLLS
jgi:hypothetical protein